VLECDVFFDIILFVNLIWSKFKVLFLKDWEVL